MFQRRHYLAIAEALREIHDNDTRQLVCSKLASLFEKDSPDFDRFRFALTCGFYPTPAGMSVSWGTLKPEDVLEALYDTAYNLLCDLSRIPEPDAIESDETRGYVIDELFDLLNDVAPPGYYFGSLEGDGADFGFWPVPEWEEA